MLFPVRVSHFTKIGRSPKKLVSYKADVADLAKLFLVALPKEQSSIIPRLDPRSKKCLKISVLYMMSNEIPHETHR